MTSVKTFGVAETARLLLTDVITLKKWSYLFQSYLNPNANPEKGKIRIFTIVDIRVFAYVLLYWETEPDIDYIKMGLDSNSHYYNEPIDNLIKSLTPIFSPMPADMDENWNGVVFGGEFELGNLYESAKSFKLAGDRLIEAGLTNYEERELFQPAMYSYRHALELYIKSITGEEINHDLIKLFEKLIILARKSWSQKLPNWLHDLIKSFDSVDPASTAFRYGTTLPVEELYADMAHIRDLMEWASQIFAKISYAQENVNH